MLHLSLQGCLLEGLLNKVDRAFLQSADRHRDVAVAGNEDDRQIGFSRKEMLLDLKAAHARHADVKHQNCNRVRIILRDEGFAAVIKLDLIVVCFEQPAKRVADGVVVIHDVNGTLGILSRCIRKNRHLMSSLLAVSRA